MAAAAQAAAEGDAEEAEAMGLVDMVFGLETWENEVEGDGLDRRRGTGNGGSHVRVD